MTQVNGEKLMNEMNGFLNDAAKENSDAEIALPFEAFEDYSTNPVSFNEQSKLMLQKVDAVFDLAVKYNRRSSQYLKACGQLEQGIKYLASGCMTKIALEAKKHELPDLGQLSTEKLFRMTSYHYRKIDRALSEYIREKNGEVDDALLDMEFRFYNLLNRLRSTEVKIHDYNEKRYRGEEDYSPVVGGLAFTEKSWNRSFNEEHIEPASFQRARAFSGISEIGNQKSEISGQCSVAGGQCSAKSEIGNQKSEISGQCSVSSGQCSAKTEIGNQKSEITNGQGPVSSGQVTADSSLQPVDGGNEEGRIKNEENEVSDNTSHSSLQTPTFSEAADSSLQTPHYDEVSNTSEAELKHITKYSPYLDILKNAVMRAPQDPAHPDQIVYSFTTEEMILLSKDKEFAEVFPDMAADIRAEVIKMYGSG